MWLVFVMLTFTAVCLGFTFSQNYISQYNFGLYLVRSVLCYFRGGNG